MFKHAIQNENVRIVFRRIKIAYDNVGPGKIMPNLPKSASGHLKRKKSQFSPTRKFTIQNQQKYRNALIRLQLVIE